MITALTQWLGIAADTSGKRETMCLCCGKCCEAFGGHLNASKSDLERWQREKRDDLLTRVNWLGWIWVDPVTKQPEEQCPFLDRSGITTAVCLINDTKPAMCRAYPTLAHGRKCLSGIFLTLVILVWDGVGVEMGTVVATFDCCWL